MSRFSAKVDLPDSMAFSFRALVSRPIQTSRFRTQKGAVLRIFTLLITTFSVAVLNFPNQAEALPQNPIVFVTQPPHPADFATINSTFGNHLATMDAVPRGGDLYIRYADGSLRNLTQLGGYGESGMQGANAIAVRDPAVHWNAKKIIFSMLIGAPTAQYQVKTFRWQLYEVSGLEKSETPSITKVANQPNYNNIMPSYASDDRIIFVTDRPRNGETHLYPQRDEYESAATNSGLWSLDSTSGDLFQLDHAPSGDFNPFVDSFGRVIFTRWDHLQRDQQNVCSQPYFKAFNYSSEAVDAQVLANDNEVFPEPRSSCEADSNDNLDLHSFNLFFPWQINEDGTDMETINHIGRHELSEYMGKSFNNDPNVEEFYQQYSRVNQNPIENFFQIQESQTEPGRYYGINAPEFGTHASGQIVSIYLAPGQAPDQVQVQYVTHPDTALTDETPSVNHIGLTRDVALMSDGTIIAAHSSSTMQDSNIGTTTAPASRYDYRIKTFQKNGEYFQPSAVLSSGINKTISYWSPDQLITYSNVTMWELQPREVVAKTPPIPLSSNLPEIEAQVFTKAGVDIAQFRTYLLENSLALVISRNVTTRDQLDHQQPRNLRVYGSSTQTLAGSGKIYDIKDLQFFQGDQIRGYGGGSANNGRRVLAQDMHDVQSNIPNTTGPSGSVAIASDGSMAAFVPARRALTYQLTDPSGAGVVRERFWLTFQPGEIRVCTSCHGVNSKDQSGANVPTNEPQALSALLEHWQGIPHETKSYKIAVAQGNKKGKAKGNKIYSGKSFTLKITGNTAAASSQVAIGLKINGHDCGSLGTVNLSSKSKFSKSRKAPVNGSKVKLEFSVKYLGLSQASKNVALLPKVGKKKKSEAKLCTSFSKLF